VASSETGGIDGLLQLLKDSVNDPSELVNMIGLKFTSIGPPDLGDLSGQWSSLLAQADDARAALQDSVTGLLPSPPAFEGINVDAVLLDLDDKLTAMKEGITQVAEGLTSTLSSFNGEGSTTGSGIDISELLSSATASIQALKDQLDTVIQDR